MAKISYRDAINQALSEEMRRDESVIVFGEDVALYEGSFKVTKGLLKEFGEKRVFDTPISEAAIVGMAIGAALDGMRPVPELMTVNFAYLAMDQILNHMALMRYMFGGQVTLPITIRMPGGGGHQLGSQHSNSLEAFFVHCPGLKVVYPATPADAKSLLKASIRDENPVIFLEHEGLYNSVGEVPDGLDAGVIGQAGVLRGGPLPRSEPRKRGAEDVAPDRPEGTGTGVADITLVAYGAMTHVALAAAGQLAQDHIEAEVIDLRTLRPWDTRTVMESVARTHRAVIVEETPPHCGIGAEIAATVCEQAFDELDAPLRRVSRADAPLPYARELEQACIPHAADVVKAAKQALS
jgi:pyruvate dehydrogenase E1 component beta subunit